jgi:hypothetical protein
MKRLRKGPFFFDALGFAVKHMSSANTGEDWSRHEI